MAKIYPLIICGGNGTRLWPVSRTQSPKQFQKISADAPLTFFQTAVKRHQDPAFAEPIIVSSVRHQETVVSQLREIEAEATIILEPMGRNTGPAVLASAMSIVKKDPEALLLVLPADHVIEGDMNTTINMMNEAARSGYIITFGIKPRYAETGFGYITDGGPIAEFPGLHKVQRFVEKPPTRKARLLVESDIAYWASGISMFSASTIMEEYQRLDAETYAHVEAAVEKAEQTPSGLLLDAEHFQQAGDEPTESVVFEKTRKITLAPLDVDWNDVGSWTAMHGISAPNADGNVFQGDVIAVDTRNTMVRSDDRLVSVVGLEDVIIVDTPDALLVTKVGACQNVKKVAEHLKATKRIEVEAHKRSQHDWGTFRKVVQEDSFTMSRMIIKPRASLALDPVGKRSATVVRGELEVSCGSKIAMIETGQQVDLNATQVSRLSNPTDDAIEVVLMSVPEKITATEVVPVALYVEN